MWARIGMVAVLAITACYAPVPSPGAPCGPGGACPEGLRCSTTNLCLTDESATDAAPVDDTPPDAPRARWALVHSTGALGGSISIPSPQPGSTLLVAIETEAFGQVMALSDDDNTPYTPIPASHADNLGKNSLEVWIARAAPVPTALTAVGAGIGAIVVWEVAGLDPVDPVVDVTTLDNQPMSTMPKGALATTSARGQFVLSIALVANTIEGIVPGAFTNDETTFGNGWAHLTDDDAPIGDYQATWTQPVSSTSCATSVVLRTADQ